MNSLATDQLYIKPYAGMYTGFFLVEKEARSGPGPLASKRLDDLVLAERRVECPSAVSGPGAVLEEAASAERIADGLIVVDDD